MEFQKLTSLTNAGGCGCKISPQLLGEILGYKRGHKNSRLLVGNEDFDDAAVYQLENGLGLVNTIDFFSPIVDDPFVFGEIAAANAISDVYAMGGTPFLALSVLGIPSKLLPSDTATRIMEGAIKTCDLAEVVIGGGHTIENPQPIFGLAVNGTVKLEHVKRNNQANTGDLLYLTKPLGVGILSTATKLGKIDIADYDNAVRNMVGLNKIGAVLSRFEYVTAMTDVTGFGLLGHLLELCRGSGVSATLFASSISILPNVENYILQGIITSGGKRNWGSYGSLVEGLDEMQRWLFSDPQTNGGLLVCVSEQNRVEFEGILEDSGLADFSKPIGQITAKRHSSKILVVQ